MARTGTFLVPGVSKNKRRYTPENIAKAVGRMSARLAAGIPIPMHTSHLKNAEGDSEAIAANVHKVWQDPATGKGRFEYEFVGTPAGKTIEKLVDAKALKTVSIFGNWVGDPEKDDDGIESADDLDVPAIDFTYRPGVSAARLDEELAAACATSGAGIWESFEGFDFGEESGELEETEAPPSILALLEAEMAHVFEDGFCRQCLAEMAPEAREAAAATKAPYGDVAYTGYQKDGKKRYPVDTKAHVRSAWAYISKASNAAKYTAQQLKRVKAKILSAAKKFGIDIAQESEQLHTLLEHLGNEITDAIEAYASACLDNGQGTISVSAYTDEPADLPKVGAAVARAALAGLINLDPDNDGDVDLPGGGDAPPGDGDKECESCGASDVPGTAMFCPTCGQPIPGAESSEPDDPTKEAAMADKTYTAEEVKTLVGPERAAKLDAAKTTFTSEELIIELAKPVPEAAPAKEETELEKARRLVAEADAAEAAKPATLADIAALLETERPKLVEQAKAELIEEQRRSGTGPSRKGLSEAAEDIVAAGLETDAEKLSKMSPEEFQAELGKGIGSLIHR